ncbi:MAG: hypothetical protein KAJ19_04665 [Gammaproteobacteria bacterium]|nr:hypothetical protein [Gammaproteobacteria bacterium]
MESTCGKIEIDYHFEFISGRTELFQLAIDTVTLELPGAEDGETLPEWTRLSHCCCSHCPLDEAEVSHCPLAVQLIEPMSRLGDIVSYEETRVRVSTWERTVVQATTAEAGISSMLGLISATSGCPYTAFFKPMARFHLPFSSQEETVYRATSMYLLGQYFQQGESKEMDLSFSGLEDIYGNIAKVNAGMAERLRGVGEDGGTLNAIIVLDMFAKVFSVAIKDVLERLRYLYRAYL